MMVSERSKQEKHRLKVAQVVQASCQAFIIGLIQNPPLPNSKQPGVADPALSAGLDLNVPRDAAQRHY